MDRSKTPWGWKHAPLAAFVTLAMFGGVAIHESAQSDADAIRNAGARACERVNDLRAQVNDQGSVVKQFLESAAVARETTGDPDVATQYRDLKKLIVRVPATDCEKAFR